jgi:RNA polymerase sigma factor (sigma-70 family)
MSDEHWSDVQELMANADWAVALARRLVGDEAAARDVAQDALLAAVSQPLSVRGQLSQWLAGTIRHLAARHARTAATRLRRERCAARRESMASTADLAMRLESQRLLAQTILGLDDIYREAILLRFVEGLPQRSIAERLQVPVATIQSRLARALAQLRRRLDRIHGQERSSWLTVLAPLAARRVRSLHATTGALAMKMKSVTLTLALLVTFGAGAAIIWPREADMTRFEVAGPAYGPSAAPASPRRREVAPQPIPRTEAPPSRAALPPVPPPVAAPAQPMLTITVVDGPGGPAAAGAEVFVRHRHEPKCGSSEALDELRRKLVDCEDVLDLAQRFGRRFVTNAKGSVSVPLPHATSTLFARRGERCASSPAARAQNGAITLVLLDRLAVDVRVVDDTGMSVSGIAVALTRAIGRKSVPIALARTNPRGEARLALPIEREAHALLAVQIAGPLAAPVGEKLDASALPTSPIILRAPATGCLEVDVKSASGAPLQDGTLVRVLQAALLDEEPYLINAMALAAPVQNGRARFPHVGAGLALAIAAGLRWDQPPTVVETPGPGSGPTTVAEIVVAGRIVELTGRIVDARGVPRAGALIEVSGQRPPVRDHWDATLETGSDGRFTWLVADEGRIWRLEVGEAGSDAQTRIEVAIPKDAASFDVGDLVVPIGGE